MTQDVGQARNDVDEAAQDIDRTAAQVVADRASLVEDQAELEAERAREAAKKVERDATAAELLKEQEALAEFDEEAESIRTVIADKQAAIGEQQAIAKTIDAEVDKASRDHKQAQSLVAKLNKENPWIEDDKACVGAAWAELTVQAIRRRGRIVRLCGSRHGGPEARQGRARGPEQESTLGPQRQGHDHDRQVRPVNMIELTSQRREARRGAQEEL